MIITQENSLIIPCQVKLESRVLFLTLDTFIFSNSTYERCASLTWKNSQIFTHSRTLRTVNMRRAESYFSISRINRRENSKIHNSTLWLERCARELLQWKFPLFLYNVSLVCKFVHFAHDEERIVKWVECPYWSSLAIAGHHWQQLSIMLRDEPFKSCTL